MQTLYPKHYSILHACRQDYEAFFADELRYRAGDALSAADGAGEPRGQRGPDARTALADATTLAQHLRARADAGRFRVLGPAPAPVAKLRGEYRAQLFLKGSHRAAMREAVLGALAAEPECGAAWPSTSIRSRSCETALPDDPGRAHAA